MNPNGIISTRRPRNRSEASRIRFRLNRSTNTPANSPTNSVGSAVTISTRPTFSADPVILKTRIPAARSVSEDPIVETSWANQSSEKSRFRKIWNIARESTGRRCRESGRAIRAGW